VASIFACAKSPTSSPRRSLVRPLTGAAGNGRHQALLDAVLATRPHRHRAAGRRAGNPVAQAVDRSVGGRCGRRCATRFDDLPAPRLPTRGCTRSHTSRCRTWSTGPAESFTTWREEVGEHRRRVLPHTTRSWTSRRRRRASVRLGTARFSSSRVIAPKRSDGSRARCHRDQRVGVGRIDTTRMRTSVAA